MLISCVFGIFFKSLAFSIFSITGILMGAEINSINLYSLMNSIFKKEL